MGRRGYRLELRRKVLVFGTAMPWIGRQPIALSSSVVLSVVALGVPRPC
jgi:hypothetical protein